MCPSRNADTWRSAEALCLSRHCLEQNCFSQRRWRISDFSSYGAAIDAVVVVDCKIAVTRMRLDHSELHWLAAPRAGVVDKHGQRHGEPFRSRRIEGTSNLDCEGLGRLATAPQSGRIMHLRAMTLTRRCYPACRATGTCHVLSKAN
jgi:hypothetical protein